MIFLDLFENIVLAYVCNFVLCNRKSMLVLSAKTCRLVTFILIYHPKIVVKGSYMISNNDGRASMNGWKKFINNNPNLKIRDKLLFFLNLGMSGAFLFVA
jgi:hypothetical protein